jgi:hypothetical protein
MMKMGGAVLRATMALVIPATLMGCRETEPEPLHNLDLGSGRTILMPPSSERNSTAIAKGQADWHPFRDPLAEPPPRAAESDDGENGAETSELEAEIRELIAEYNEVVVDGTVEELLDYFVEAQHEKLSSVLTLTVKLRDEAASLQAALEAKLPDARQRIQQALGTNATGLSGAVDVVDVEIVSDEEVAAKTAAAEYRFSLVDEDWYFEISQVDEHATDQTLLLEQAMTRVGGWVSALGADQSKPDEVLAQIEEAAQARVETPAPAPEEAAEVPEDSEKPADDNDAEGG